MQTVNENKVKAALRASGDTASQEKLDALVCLELDKEKLIDPGGRVEQKGKRINCETLGSTI